jgi:hypothetical protein
VRKHLEARRIAFHAAPRTKDVPERRLHRPMRSPSIVRTLPGSQTWRSRSQLAPLAAARASAPPRPA